MAVRATMADLITNVRVKIRDTDEDYFTSQEIQDELDKADCRLYIDRELLIPDVKQKVYQSNYDMFEGDASTWSGAETIAIYDTLSDSATEKDPDSWNLIDGTFTYTSDQNDPSRYLTGWSYDIYRAAGRLCMSLYLLSSITPGASETGGAIVGRYDYRLAAREFFAMARRVNRQINRQYVG